jgi:serine/threonine protein kinase
VRSMHSQVEYAVKMIEVKEPIRRNNALREAKLLLDVCRSLNHPNIIRLEGFFEVTPFLPLLVILRN